ncbi:hypothetical protein ACROYT_G021484 [Oculina patagonica]
MRDITKNYNPRVRPVLHQNDTVIVTLGMSLHQIIDLNEKNQILVSIMWIRQVWYNPLLFWDPRKYENISKINVSPNLLWKPDLVLYNNANDNTDGALNKFDTDITVHFSGKNTWLAPVIFKSTCKINVAFFPFDEQNCTLKIGSWASDGLRLDLRPESEVGETNNFVNNGEWDLIEIKARRNVHYYICCKEPFPDVTFRLRIRRRTLFYYMNLLIPCFLLTGVNFLSFSLPPDSGERITLVVTSLLTMTVFMLLVAEIMPPVSDVVPIISVYYVTAMFVVLGRIVRFKSSSNIKRQKRNDRIKLATSHSRSTSVKPKTNDPLQKLSQHVTPRSWNDDLIVQKLSSICSIMEEKMESEKQIEEWQEAAIILDKFFFRLFIAVAVAGTLVVFLQNPSAQQ